MQYKLSLGGADANSTADTKKSKSAASGFISSLWHFPEAGAKSIYRWYGTLPQPLIEQLFTLYCGNEDCRILDPFVGSGSTLELASKKNYVAEGWDTNPLACLITQTRLGGFTPVIERLLSDSLPEIDRKLSKKRRGAGEKRFNEEQYAYARKWFREDTLSRTLDLLEAISQVANKDLQRLLFVLTAQEVRNVASVDPRCTHHLVRKEKKYLDPWQSVRENCIKSSSVLYPKSELKSFPTVTQKSAIDQDVGAEVDFVLAHPPYLGVIHYHLIHRLATDLLGYAKQAWAPASLRSLNFENTIVRQTDVSTDNEKPYDQFVSEFAMGMAKKVKAGGVCALIIGDQRHQGRLRHPFTTFIAGFESNGFVLEENFIWALHNNGGMHVLRRGHFIDHNYVLIFRRIDAPGPRGRNISSRSGRSRSKD